ncbi:lysophospholipase L1-like esterase [Kroppenstedtia sanguinis]|uniref:GDSL-type esterase/lipase family protein n=1 Tax=Kroppenstedtia sanguinis TaxID=1380684 RepID=UPI003D1D3231
MKRWIWAVVSLCLILSVIKFYPMLQWMFAGPPPEPVMMTQENILTQLREKAKEKAELNYLVLGDSVARGFGSEKSDSHGYSSLVAKELAKDQIPLQLINRGVIGQTSKQLTGYIQTPNIQQEIREADLISLTIGGNDLLKAALQDHDPLRILTDFDQIQSRYKKNLDTILTEIRAHNRKAPILITSLYNPVLPDEPYFKISNRLLKNWNIGMKEVAYSYRLTHVVDVTERLIAGKGNWLSDEIHPNDRGYRWMAEGILDEIRANRSVSASAR